MKLPRIFGAAFAAMLAICLMTAVVATARQPEFQPSTTTIKATSTGGEVVLEHALTSEQLKCASHEVTEWAIFGWRIYYRLVLKGCEAINGPKTCKARSTGKEFSGKSGEIITVTTKGELGEVASSESTSGVGILLKPESGTVFTEVEGETSGCLIKARWEGSLAGEVTPVGQSQTTDKMIFRGSDGSESIKSITVMGTHHTPELKALSGLVTVSESAEDNVTFEQAVEVT
jgi:hypothetical protein